MPAQIHTAHDCTNANYQICKYDRSQSIVTLQLVSGLQDTPITHLVIYSRKLRNIVKSGTELFDIVGVTKGTTQVIQTKM